ncbi:MAG: TatD family hydrolase [Treponema sp.]|jgi:TatD DNase family protein|nr:TatD family hydrolase [Treponema sp.]
MPVISYTDTHAHLSGLEQRGIKVHELLGELFRTGEGPEAPRLGAVLDISLEPGDLARRIKAFSGYPRVRFASGLWPHEGAIRERHKKVPELEKDIRSAPPGLVCALGEFGLDHHWNSEDHGSEGSHDMAGERELMEMQLDLAARLGLPVIIHSREAFRETLDLLSRYKGTRGVIHCFSYGSGEAGAFLDRGYYISFAGNLSFKNAAVLRESCKAVPRDRLLLETDCPYLAPGPYRGGPSHPGMIEETYACAAEIRNTGPEDLAELVRLNAAELFGPYFCVPQSKGTGSYEPAP